MLDVLDDSPENSGLEKFELLSAYLDGEVTTAERQQVDLWLQKDASFRAMYSKMCGMHKAIEQIPLPSAALTVNKFADEVFTKVDQRSKLKLLKVVGGTCLAGLVAAGAMLTATFQGFNQSQLQIAKISLPTSVPNSLSILVKPTPLMVTLNDSIVQISPKGVVPKAKADIIDLLDDGDDL